MNLRLLLLSLPLLLTLNAAEHFVTTTGSATGDGTAANPWDLQTALNHPARVQPGDTIWLRGGTYRGSFRAELRGTAAAPILVRQYPGERASIDVGGQPAGNTHALAIFGEHAWYWGFTVTNSSTATRSFAPSTEPGGDFDRRSHGVVILGPHIKLINTVIHNTGNPLGIFGTSIAAEVYGNLIFNNGWSITGLRGHGEGMYMQNNADPIKRIMENIVFQQFDSGIIAYGSSDARINNFHFEGNVLFDNGRPNDAPNGWGFLLGGGSEGYNHTLLNNYIYNAFDYNRSNNLDVGYREGLTNVVVRGNYSAGMTAARHEAAAVNLQATGNTLIGGLLSQAITQYSAAQNTILAAPPARSDVFVRANSYERGRGHIVIFNWLRSSSLSVDLTPVGLQSGDTYEIRDAQNFLGNAVLTGTFNAATPSVTLPLTLTTMAPMYGTNIPHPPRHTPTEFNTFVVLKTGLIQGTAATPVITPAGGTFSAPVTVALTCATSGASIRYTLNGTTPTASSPLYSAPFTLSSSATVRAKAFRSGMNDSATATATFTLNLPPPNRAPLISSPATAAPNPCYRDQAVTFTVSAADPDGDSLSYTWTFGDGNSASGSSATHTYAAAGNYTASATILDGKGGSASSQVSITVNNDLVVHWRFDEGSGTYAADASGRSNTGTLVSGTSWTSGVLGGAVNCDGITGGVIKNPVAAFPTTAISAAFWMKASNKSKAGTPLSYAVSSQNNEFLIYNYNNFAVYVKGSYVATGVSATDGVWHHIAVSWRSSDGQVVLYMDGVPRATRILRAGSTLNSGGSLFVGQEQDTVGGGLQLSQAFAGQLDDVRVYNRVLSATEIAALASPAPGGVALAEMLQTTDDSDGDGLLDRYEQSVALDPFSSDSDNNDTLDGDELTAEGVTHLEAQQLWLAQQQQNAVRADEGIIDLGNVTLNKPFRRNLEQPPSLAGVRRTLWKPLNKSQLPKGIRIGRAKIHGRAVTLGQHTFTLSIEGQAREVEASGALRTTKRQLQQTYRITVVAPDVH